MENSTQLQEQIADMYKPAPFMAYVVFGAYCVSTLILTIIAFVFLPLFLLIEKIRDYQNSKIIKIGDTVYIKENARVLLGLPNGIEYTVKDIEDDIQYPIILCADELGKDWEQFFCIDELIKIK
jgi:hypothetical protein